MCKIEILRDRSESALKQALETNLLLYIKSNVIPGEEVLDTDEVFRWYCGSNILLLNWVLNARFTSRNVTEIRLKVKEHIDYFKKRKVSFLWWNGPSTKPSNLGEIMQDMGMLKFDLSPESGDMVMDIRNLEDMERNLSKIVKKTGIKIRTMRSKEELHDGVKIAAKTMGLSEEFQERGELSSQLALKEDPSTNVLVGYIAYIDDTPVSVSTVFYGGGVAGLYSVGTLPKFQHRGIGTAITLAPLIDARKRGYEIAVLTATPQGFPIYKRIGFTKLEVIEQYGWISQGWKRFLYRIYFRLQRVKNKKKNKKK